MFDIGNMNVERTTTISVRTELVSIQVPSKWYASSAGLPQTSLKGGMISSEGMESSSCHTKMEMVVV